MTPFRQDLAKYAAQSEHLDGENSKKARELQELHMQLAGTMGHQNQKQKIKYVVRILFLKSLFFSIVHIGTILKTSLKISRGVFQNRTNVRVFP